MPETSDPTDDRQADGRTAPNCAEHEGDGAASTGTPPACATGLKIRTESGPEGHTVRLLGELDMACSGALDTCIAELCADGARSIVVEMGELRFMDSTGLRSLLVGQELCEVNGCALTIGALSAQVQRLFEVSGVGELLHRRADGGEPAPGGQTAV
jgi:anti-sigma B factor antagonist